MCDLDKLTMTARERFAMFEDSRRWGEKVQEKPETVW